MRRWVKYLHDFSVRGEIFKEKSKAPEDLAVDMGGYQPDTSYKRKDSFFENWYLNKDNSRLQTYNNFIQSHLDKKAKILSLASGRCAAELYLLEKGYDIVCSDLKELKIHDDAKQLIPSFRFSPLDILKPSLHGKYDAVTAFSLIYLFDKDDLNLFFENVSNSLSMGGNLILDPGGASDSRTTLFMDEFILKYETLMKRIILFVFGKPSASVVKHHGFRRSDQEIIVAAKEAGFELVATEYDDFFTELRRSWILQCLLGAGGFVSKAFSVVGRKMPYVRLFLFKRIA